MHPPFYVEVRTGGDTKSELRTIINDVADEFSVTELSEAHVVPHVPLFGPYDTARGSEVKRQLIETLSDFDVVPYRIAGFDTFHNEQRVDITVVPSIELVSLRKQIGEVLQPLTKNYPAWDEDLKLEFRIPVVDSSQLATGNVTAVLEYLESRFDPTFDEYATRVTSLRNEKILWEYDLLQDRVLEQNEATSATAWRRTEELLDERASPTDFRSLVTAPIAPLVAELREKGWAYFPDPTDHVTERARQDGLFQADGRMRRRELYLGETYVYLAIAAARSTDDVHVLSMKKSAFYGDTIEQRCPVCEESVHRYEDDRLLPCPHCGLQYELRDEAPDADDLTSATEPVLCVRCERPVASGGVQFEDRVYCTNCVTLFEEIAEEGVVVRSRHDEPDYDEIPYVIHWDGTAQTAENQIEALARGKEVAERNDVAGLFIYQRRGSHWILDAYLDAHPDLRSKVVSERRKIRGEQRVQMPALNEEKSSSSTATYDIRAGGDVFVAENVVNDAVVNRADIGTDDSGGET